MPRTEREAGEPLRARRQQADHRQRQQPAYLPGELLVEEPQWSRLAVLTNAARSTASSRSALRGASPVSALSVGGLLGGLPVARSPSGCASRWALPPDQAFQAVVAEGQVER